MSTIYNFNEELPQLGSGPATSDITFVFNSSSGRVKQCTVSQSRFKTVTKSTNFPTSASTSCFFAANEGVSNVQATSSGVMFVTSPSAAGQEVQIWAQSTIGTTGIKQINVATSAGANTPSFDGTNCVLNIASSNPFGVTLMSLSTTQWAVTALYVAANQTSTSYTSYTLSTS